MGVDGGRVDSESESVKLTAARTEVLVERGWGFWSSSAGSSSLIHSVGMMICSSSGLSSREAVVCSRVGVVMFSSVS